MISAIALTATGVFINFLVEKKTLRDKIKDGFMGLIGKLKKENQDRKDIINPQWSGLLSDMD